MFNSINIYSFIALGGCVSIGPSALLCSGAYYTVKTALPSREYLLSATSVG